MALKQIRCPHCGHSVTQSVNENVKMSNHHTVCSKCHKSYSWTADYGRVMVSK